MLIYVTVVDQLRSGLYQSKAIVRTGGFDGGGWAYQSLTSAVKWAKISFTMVGCGDPRN